MRGVGGVLLIVGLIALYSCASSKSASDSQDAPASNGGSPATTNDATSVGGATTPGETTTGNTTTMGGATTTSAATTTTDASSVGGTGPLCDQGCGDALSALVLAPVPIADLPGVGVAVCVDEALCGSGTFPNFDPNDGFGNYFPDSVFSTMDVEVDGNSAPFSLLAYRAPTYAYVGIFHPFVVGDSLSVTFESQSGEDLGRVDGVLETTTTVIGCPHCVGSTFSNLPTE